MSPEIPRNLIPEAKGLVQEVRSALRQDRSGSFSRGTYGHALGNLAFALSGMGAGGESPENQRRVLERRLDELLGRFGSLIVPYLGDDLRRILLERKASLSPHRA